MARSIIRSLNQPNLRFSTSVATVVPASLKPTRKWDHLFLKNSERDPTLPASVKIVEVGPRDGLQNEKELLPTPTKIRFIELLAASGLKKIEATAFVNARWVPQMGDHTEVLHGLRPKVNGVIGTLRDRELRDGVSFPVLTPNIQGLKAAIAAGATEVAVFAAASETFSKTNINCTIKESLDRFQPVVEEAKRHNVRVRGYISCVLGCPYEGEISPTAVSSVAQALHDMGCYEISLGDTIGTGTAFTTRRLIGSILSTTNLKTDQLAVHFHDTYNQVCDLRSKDIPMNSLTHILLQALSNIFAALQMGISTIDSACSGSDSFFTSLPFTHVLVFLSWLVFFSREGWTVSAAAPMLKVPVEMFPQKMWCTL